MRCNNMMAALDRAYADGNLTQVQYNELKAEAASLRGMYYYLLTAIFGDVPFYTSAVETTADQDRVARLPRMSAVDTRAYIVDELLDLLDNEGVLQKRTYDNPESSDYRKACHVECLSGQGEQGKLVCKSFDSTCTS